MLFSDMGGIDIEQVADEHPDHVARAHFSTLRPFEDWQAKQLIASLGITGAGAQPADADPRAARAAVPHATT